MYRLLTLTSLLLAVTASPQNGKDVCTQWCAANFPNPGKDCISLAARGKGPCYDCGPLKTYSSHQLCSGKCTDTAFDAQNCGACGDVCEVGTTCCGGTCTNPADDDYNCGTCGNVCDSDSTCTSGVCQKDACPPPQELCGGTCTNPFTDNQNCGVCGNVCGTGAACENGACTGVAIQCYENEDLSFCGSVCANEGLKACCSICYPPGVIALGCAYHGACVCCDADGLCGPENACTTSGCTCNPTA